MKYAFEHMCMKYFYVECYNSKTWCLEDDFEGKPLNLSRIKLSFSN